MGLNHFRKKYQEAPTKVRIGMGITIAVAIAIGFVFLVFFHWGLAPRPDEKILIDTRFNITNHKKRLRYERLHFVSCNKI